MRPFVILARVCTLLATLSLAQAPAPVARAALVIGNADYSFGPLSSSLTGLWASGRGEETLTPEQ